MEALRAAIDSVISGRAVGAEFYFLLEAGGMMTIRKADLDEEAQSDLKLAFVGSIRESIWQDELSLLKIASADDRSNAIYEYDLETVPPRLQHLSEVLARDDFQVFDSQTDSLSQIKAIIILIGHGEHQLALYKHQYPVNLLKQDKSFSFIRGRQQTQRFERLTDDILRINTTFEFFKIADKYYILDLKALERFFGFHEAIKNVAIAGLENIARSNLVENTTLLEARLEDISFARKLVRVARSSPVLNVIPNSEVITFVQTHPALRGRFAVNAGGTQLRLATKVAQNLFLKLLNDDFLQSELTKRHYDSLAKDALDVGA